MIWIAGLFCVGVLILIGTQMNRNAPSDNTLEIEDDEFK